MTEPLGVGVLGCADVAVRRVLPAMAQTPGVRLVAVASRSRAKAEHVAGTFGCTAVTGYQNLLELPEVAAVYLPLPSGLHAPWIRRCLQAGRHVLAEKPLTCDPAQTAALLALAAERHLVVRENYMFVRHSQHAAVRDLLTDGRIGEVRAFSATFAIPGRPPGDIRLDPRLGGGALFDVGGYPVRAARYFLGPDLSVDGAHLQWDRQLGVDIGGGALLHSPGGVSAQVTFGLAHGYRSAYRVLGSHGSIHLEHVFTPPADHRPRVLVRDNNRTEEVLLPAHDQYAASIAHFRDAVRGARDTDSGILGQARLVEAIRRRATVHLDPGSRAA